VVRPALLWNDTRSAGAATDLTAELGGPEAGPRRRAGPGGQLHRDQAPLAGRPRARGRGPGGRRLPAPRLADLAPGRRPRPGRPGHRPGRRQRHRLLVAGHRVLPPRPAAPRPRPRRPLPAVLGPAASPGPPRRARCWPPAPATTWPPPSASGPGPGTWSSRSAPRARCSPSPRAVGRPHRIVAGFADATGRFLPLVCTLNAARVLDAAAAMLGSAWTGCPSWPWRPRLGPAASPWSRTWRASAPPTGRTPAGPCTGSGWPTPPRPAWPGRPSRGCCAASPTAWTRWSPRGSRSSGCC
jgi:xylulokinase